MRVEKLTYYVFSLPPVQNYTRERYVELKYYKEIDIRSSAHRITQYLSNPISEKLHNFKEFNWPVVCFSVAVERCLD